MRRIFTELTDDEFERLLRIAERERRRPQDQAGILLARELERYECVSEGVRDERQSRPCA